MKSKFGKIGTALLAGLLLLSPLQAYPAAAERLTEEELHQLPGSEVLISGLLETGAAMNPEAAAYGTMADVSAETEGGYKDVLRFSTTVKPASTYGFQYELPIAGRIEEEDVLLATFYARTISSSHETAEGQVSVILEKLETWDKSLNETVAIPSQWKKFLIPIKAAKLMPANNSHVTLRLGYGPQVVEIADLTLVNYKKLVPFGSLPSTPVYYEGMEEDAPWRAEANARIEQLRKGDLEIELKDKNGQPVAGADVQVRMTKHDFKFGTAVNNDLIFGTDEKAVTYRTKLKENFNSVVMENDMKWPKWEENKARAVKLYNWLGENGLAVRGHTLIWDGVTRMPADIPGILTDKAALDKRIADHLHETAGYFRGRLLDWDVINEPVLNKTIRSAYGDEMMADWMKRAKEADPDAKLYVNETQILGVDAPVIISFSNLLQILKDKDAPLDGVGIQAHFGGTPVSPMAFYNQLSHFAQYAPEIAITEFDMNTPKEDIQGMFTRDLLLATFSHPNVQSFTMWGFWDGSHWQNNAPLFRSDWSLKPSGEQWRKLIYETWWTDVSGVTDQAGHFQTRGFYGDYDVIITRDGVSQTVKTSLLKGQENKVSIVWGVDAPSRAAFEPLPIPAQTGDITPPVWPYGSTFGVSEASPTSVALTWPQAVDNKEVDQYLIYQDGQLIKQVDAAVTGYDVTELTPGTSYTFTVVAADKMGNRSVASPVLTAQTTADTDAARPGWLKGSFITINHLGGTEAELSWPHAVDNDGIAGYRVYVNGNAAGDTVEPQFTLANLMEDSLYTIRVEAKDAAGNLSLGGPVVTLRTLGTEDTAAPVWESTAALTAETIAADRVTLNWGSASDTRGIAAYRLFRGSEELTTVPASVHSFQVEGLSSNTAYLFRVEAGDDSGNWSVSGPSLTVTTKAAGDQTAPVWPAGRMLTYHSLADHSVTLAWTPAADNIGVTGYRLYSGDNVVGAVYGNELSYSLTGLQPDQLYHFRVEAGDASGNWSVDGPAVSVTTFDGVERKEHVIYPSDDTFIQAPATAGGDGTNNNLAYLRIKNAVGASGSEDSKNSGNNRRTYLKFPLNSVTGQVYSATLNLYVYAVQTANKDISMDLYATGDSWSETAINWKTKPQDGGRLGSTVVRNAGYWKQFAVTDYTAAEASGDKIISFKLQDDTWVDQNVDIHSKEATGANAAFKPYLSVGTEEVPTDHLAPVWQTGLVSSTGLQPQSLILNWTGAADERGINRYVIYQDGLQIGFTGSDVSHYEVNGLTPATAYTFRVEAEDGVQQSTGGPSLTVTTPAADVSAPVWPQSAKLTVTDISRTAATLHWDGATDQYGIAEYEVYQGDTRLATVSGTVLSYHVTGLTPGSEQLFRVIARDQAGNQAAGPEYTVTTLAPDTASPVWSGEAVLTASPISASGILLGWPAATDDTKVAQYRIYNGETLLAQVSGTVRGYYVTGLAAGAGYDLSVVAADEAGNLTQPLKQEQVKTLEADTITPQWPTGSRITVSIEQQTGQATLQWDPAVDNIAVKQYVLYRGAALLAVVNGDQTGYSWLSTDPSDTVYKVEAVDLSGNTTVMGPTTADPEHPVPTDSTPPGWPAGSILTADIVTATKIGLSWSQAVDRMGVVQYKLMMNGTTAATTEGTTWEVNGLSPSTAYSFKVEAADAAGNWSATGPVLQVTTKSANVEQPYNNVPAADPVAKVEVSGGKTIVTIASQGVKNVDGQVQASLDKKALQAAFDKADAQPSGGKTIRIVLPNTAAAKGYALTLPASFLTESQSSDKLELSTEIGMLLLPKGMLANQASVSGQENITVAVTKAQLPSTAALPGQPVAALEFTVAANGKALTYNNKAAAVAVSVTCPLTGEQRSHPELLNVWYMNAAGKAELVPSGQYDRTSGEIRFTTNHFSTFAVTYNKRAFSDTATTPWAEQAITALAAKGIINGDTADTFSPLASVTRGDFAKLLVGTLGLTASFGASFSDVSLDDYYYEAVGIAHQLGIVNGMDDGRFEPQAQLTRQDMFVMIARALQQTGKTLPQGAPAQLSTYSDQEQVADYAVAATATLVKAGLVEGNAGKLAPLSDSTRAETAVILYRLFQSIYQ